MQGRPPRSITAWGTHGTLAHRKWAFSRARCWHTETAAADGDTGRCVARKANASAGTFSNSVVRASHCAAIADNPGRSR